MIAWFIITASALLACLGIYQLMKDRDAKPPAKAKVYPLDSDDIALQEHYRKCDAVKVAELRSTREASRKLYEYFTLPKIYWAHHERQMASDNIRERTHQPNNGAELR